MTYRFAYFLPISLALFTGHASILAQSYPQPGDLYREFARHADGDRDWRVTDSRAVEKFDRAKKYLPNPKLELVVADLQHAVRAEALLDRWGGHRGTINKRIRFNDHDWISIPEIKAVPDDIRPEMLMFQDNPVVEVPLDHLVEGVNLFDADCDEKGGFGWGQWGLYSLVLRVDYDREAKGDAFAIDGRITTPVPGQSLTDGPIIQLSAESPAGVARIDVLASYDGKNHFYDYDLLMFPPQMLRSGENVLTIHSETEHHALEVLWPGPAIVARIPKPDVAIREDR